MLYLSRTPQSHSEFSLKKLIGMARGSLIVFEGLDRAGKSTQCELLYKDLQEDGIKVRHMRFPGMSVRTVDGVEYWH